MDLVKKYTQKQQIQINWPQFKQKNCSYECAHDWTQLQHAQSPE